MFQTSPETIHRRRWQILGALVLSLLVVVLDNSILNVALRTLAEPKPKGLGATQSELEWGINAYTLAFAGVLFTWGILGDRLGRKKVLLGGMLAFGASSALCAYASSPIELIAFRSLMGFTGAAVLPATLSVISNVFEPAERPKAIGIWSGAVGLAIAIGPITGGVLLAHFWWGSVFLVNVPIVAVAVVLMIWLVPDSRNPNPGRFDPIGVALSIAGIGVLVFGIIRGGDVGWTSPDALVPLLAGVALTVVFVAWERRHPSPILDVALFRDRRLAGGASVLTLVSCAYMGLVFVISFYLQAGRGYSPLHSGLMLLPLAGGQMLFSSRSSGLTQRFGPRNMIVAGTLLLVATYVYYAHATAHSSTLLLGVTLFAQGVAMGLIWPPATNGIMSAVPREKAGAASAVNNTSRQVGGALGVAILGAVLNAAYRSRIDPVLDAIPRLHHHVSDISASVSATLSYAAQSGPAGRSLASTAVNSFIDAMHQAAYGSLAIGILSVAVAMLLVPNHRFSLGGAPAGAPPATPATEPAATAVVEAVA